MKKFNDEQLSRVLSHVGEMEAGGHAYPYPGCLVQTALINTSTHNLGYGDVESWFDVSGSIITSPNKLLRALERLGWA